MKFRNQAGIALKLLRSRITGQHIPLNVMISVTNRCQSHCSYCAIPLSQQPEMNTAELLELLDQIRTTGCERIALWGGEPLVRPDIEQIIDHAKALGLYTTMDSNGYLVPESLAVIRKLDYLLLSIDGPEEVHDRNREIGSHAKVMRALQSAVGVVPVMTLTVITRHNMGRLDYILDLAERLGFVATFQLLYHNQAEAGESQDLLPSLEEHRAAIRYLMAQKKKGRPIVASFPYLRHLLSWLDFNRKTLTYRPISAPICYAGKLFCNVDVDGRVYPCNPLMREVEAESFLQTGFAAAFEAASKHACQACFSCCNEFNLMSAINLATLWNWFSYTVHRGRRRNRRE